MDKYYKVISKENKSFNGGNFDWTDYLPKKNKPGKWTPVIKDISMCYSGYHITRYWNMWINTKEDKIFEIEYKGLIENNKIGVNIKSVCRSIRLIKQIILDYNNNWNTGDSNTGDRNTGDRNTGYRNTGNRNTGNWNTGNWNTGYRNTGNWNTGDRNTGDRNTGDSNTGYRNTGNWNTGDRNTGYRNTGNRNTGNWNTGNWNTGCLNTKNPQYYEMFNKIIDKDIFININYPNYFYFNLDNEKTYKECWIESFTNADIEEIKQTIKLPNFDYKIFEEITGITKKMINNKLNTK